jgi:hypothetical protein
MTLTSRLNMPGCSIKTLKPVSKIRHRDIPSMLTKIEGVPCSNKTNCGPLATALNQVEGELNVISSLLLALSLVLCLVRNNHDSIKIQKERSLLCVTKLRLSELIYPFNVLSAWFPCSPFSCFVFCSNFKVVSDIHNGWTGLHNWYKKRGLC